MRSTTPMPGNPWPHDMSITVEDRPQLLLELLWIREAHDLRPVGETLPPRLIEMPAAAANPVDAVTRDRWSAAWSRIWEDVLAHAAVEPDRGLLDAVFSSDLSSTERERLLRELVGPAWRDDFGGDVFDDEAYRDWERRGFDSHVETRPTTLAESPEHRDVEALADAWRRGLLKVVTIPCRELHVRQIGPHALLVTDEVRGDSAQYRSALGSFAPKR